MSEAMHLGELVQQIVLKSEKAFSRLAFVDAQKAMANEWFAKKQLRDRNARDRYFDVERNSRRRGDLYITQILDEEIKPNDKRL